MKVLKLLSLALVFLLLLTALLVFCHKPVADQPNAEDTFAPWFEDVTEKVGLDFVHDAGPVGSYFMPQIMGPGCALFDFDNDDRLDIYLLQNGGPGSSAKNRLYRQLPNGRFKDVSAGSGLDIAGHCTGVAIGDINNDGLADVLVTEYGGIKLFLNQGNGKFLDVTKEAKLESRCWGSSATFVDIDRDGWLDLVVVNYLDYDPTEVCTGKGGKPDFCHPASFPGQVTRLFRNLGTQGLTPSGAVRFQDITLSSGLGAAAGRGLGVLCADFNGDGWPDIFVANDLQANHLWINNGRGTHFTEEAWSRGVAFNGMGQAQANMGVAWGDVDGDGLPDLYVTHLSEEYHTLWKQGPRGFFQDQTVAAGLARPRWSGTGFGTVMADFDHDGSLDIALVNGGVKRGSFRPEVPGLAPCWRLYAQRNQLFANDGRGRFLDISPQNRSLCGTPNVGRALACGDIDGDGALDLLVSSIGGRARLLRNVVPNRGHWLMIRALLDRQHGQRDAIGAEITVTAGKRSWYRQINPGYSYQSSCDLRAHFGMGKVDRVDLIHVAWPDGSKETFRRPAGHSIVDRLIRVRQGEGKRLKK